MEHGRTHVALECLRIGSLFLEMFWQPFLIESQCVAQAGLKLSILPLCLPGAGTIGMCLYAGFNSPSVRSQN